ncbi:small nuclear ribonucleoprotein E isoform X3 [Acinonyx jubatus]|uniref:Small nuclear ribonucleoprotein E n=1 Tax=Acinonyx jubatus TaxID=32536 RepID=A0ABM3P259_ACIJB|nr:small nuclear ribonucleoprotein E isoform X3 [Acinonyx jubatus]
MAYRGQGQKVQKVMVQPINLIFRYLQNRSRIQVWLYEQVNMRIEGCIIGFDEYMNLVLDDAEEIHSKTKSRKQLEIWRAGKAWSRAQLLFAIFQEVLSISYVRKQMMASFSCPHPGQGAPTKVLLDFINSGTVPQDSAHPRRSCDAEGAGQESRGQHGGREMQIPSVMCIMRHVELGTLCQLVPSRVQP